MLDLKKAMAESYRLDPDHANHDERELSAMTVAELLELKHRIEANLPAVSLKDINLEVELLQQYAVLKELQSDVIQDELAAPNQKAQVAGQISTILKQIVDLQERLSREEEFKKMEGALLEAVALLPDQARAKFFTEYEAIARKEKLL